jgi:hypothetical protein
MIPAVMHFWDANVRAQVPPQPSTISEIAEVYPTDPGSVLDLPENAFEVLERITVLNSDINAQTEERDALKVALSEFVGSAETLNYGGRPVATWKTQKGRQSFDKRAFEELHPELAATFTHQGSPFKVLRRLREKTK